MKKNSCTPINPKKYSCYGLKKIHTRNLITKKNSCGSKIPLPPPPPLNFSNGPSLNETTGVLGLIFAGYVPLASQSPYPIIVYSVANYLVTFGQIFNFREPSLVAFNFYELTIF